MNKFIISLLVLLMFLSCGPTVKDPQIYSKWEYVYADPFKPTEKYVVIAIKDGWVKYIGYKSFKELKWDFIPKTSSIEDFKNMYRWVENSVSVPDIQNFVKIGDTYRGKRSTEILTISKIDSGYVYLSPGNKKIAGTYFLSKYRRAITQQYSIDYAIMEAQRKILKARSKALELKMKMEASKLNE